MKKSLLILLFMCFVSFLQAQPNCEAYKHYGDTLKYEACKKAEEANAYYQFSKEFQQVLDEALAIDSTFDYAYRGKSVAYLKSGDFIIWKRLIDKAVEYNPIANLGYRGWCRYQFFRDYKGAIADIERIESLVTHDIGYSANGDYHLHIARAICYKALGQKEKALEIILSQLEDENYEPGIYDYFHLGVLYYETGNMQKAMEAFEKQEEANNIADNQYYLALVYKALGQNKVYTQRLQQAKKMHKEGREMNDPYTHPYDQVYLQDIEDELRLAKSI